MTTREQAKPVPPKSLSKQMIVFCNLEADPEERNLTRKAQGEKIGVTERTIHNWKERLDVINYTNELVEYYTDWAIAGVWKALVKSAQKGNVSAMRLFFEMKQKYVPPHQVVDLQTKGELANINIITSIPRPDAEVVKEGD
jgi:hypothetical protein